MKEPKFHSVEEERRFWETHDAVEVLGEEGWEVVEAGTTKVRSFYIARVGKHGAMVRIPKGWLNLIGARSGQKVRVWMEGNRLVVEVL